MEIRKKIEQCHERGLQIALAWDSGHSDITGNEYVGLVAKDATSCGDKILCINYSHDLVALSKSASFLCGLTTGRLPKSLKGSIIPIFKPSIPSKPWFLKFKYSKRATSTICRMRLGHCSTPMHLTKFRLRDLLAC
ncbi:hypothetical protein EVAR_19921_1 [Eumeta japonica]|uniref:Uncharacterized protein n=1 Tax=Eumeta variegata TaxID=151549 RepID=A0A4C1ZIS7_EUMVA|nr:hypothetical protein EVAR_19921_1 [Eumeta japonica]